LLGLFEGTALGRTWSRLGLLLEFDDGLMLSYAGLFAAQKLVTLFAWETTTYPEPTTH
jgi:hypothetical protein